MTSFTVAAADRTVALKAKGDPGQYRVEIRNPTAEPLTFTLGFNDQLFENREALKAWIASSSAKSCKGLQGAAALQMPCAAFETIAGVLNHHIELTDQFEQNGWADAPRWWNASPTLAVNSFGFGTCGTFAYVLGKIWNALGYDVRRRDLNGHTVTEVLVDGHWVLFDADLRGFFVQGKRLMGLDDLFANPRLASTPSSVRQLKGVRKGDFPRGGLEFYNKLIKVSTGHWRDPKDVPPGMDDWRELTFTLPPSARLVFPEPKRSPCLFPEYVGLSRQYGKVVLDPPFRFAGMYVPAGTRVTNMVNGLFPLEVTGTYSLEAVYHNETEKTSAFDQAGRFRFSRRFAREFRDVEAVSDMKIDYMINARVSVRAENEVRLHGDSVANLEVALLRVPKMAQGEAQPPCIQPPKQATVPVKSVSASTCAYGNEALTANLTDGSLVTNWTSAILPTPEPQRVILDLGSPQLIRGIRWAPSAQYGMMSPTSITVSTSRDANQIDEAVTISDYEPSQVGWLERAFEPRVAQYVMVTLIPKNHFLLKEQYQTTLGEIEIIGTPQGMTAASTQQGLRAKP